MPLVDMARYISQWVTKIKVNKDTQHKAMIAIIEYLPTFIIGPLKAAVAYLTQNVGISVDFFKMKAN